MITTMDQVNAQWQQREYSWPWQHGLCACADDCALCCDAWCCQQCDIGRVWGSVIDGRSRYMNPLLCTGLIAWQLLLCTMFNVVYDPTGMVPTMYGPTVTVQNMQMVDPLVWCWNDALKTMAMCAPQACVVAYLRRRTVSAFHIDEGACESCLSACCCGCCSVSQAMAELDAKGRPSGGTMCWGTVGPRSDHHHHPRSATTQPGYVDGIPLGIPVLSRRTRRSELHRSISPFPAAP